jgi:hypothetical protein
MSIVRGLLMALCAAALSASACGPTSAVECDCAIPGARLHVQPEIAGAVRTVRLGGPACANLTATCTQAAAMGCATWSLTPSTAGSCTIDVIFADATFSTTLSFAQATGCCAGVYPVPVSAGEIDVAHEPSDAGGPG